MHQTHSLDFVAYLNLKGIHPVRYVESTEEPGLYEFIFDDIDGTIKQLEQQWFAAPSPDQQMLQMGFKARENLYQFCKRLKRDTIPAE